MLLEKLLGLTATDEATAIKALSTPTVDRIGDLTQAPTFVCGGRETQGALPAETDLYQGAIYSSRGRGYTDHNEDGAFLLKAGDEVLVGGALDQAGGLGGDVRGEASEIGAKSLVEAYRSISPKLFLAMQQSMLTASQKEEIFYTMTSSLQAAHQELTERGQGEVSTAVSAVVGKSEALLVNSGDSGAMLYSKDGLLRMKTKLHNVEYGPAAGYLIHGLGMLPEGPGTDTYCWPMQQGDWLILGSDGLLDAQLTDNFVRKLIKKHSNPTAMVNELCGNILFRMLTLRAKADNLTVVAMRRR